MKRENNHGEGGHVCPSFLQEMPDSATFISGVNAVFILYVFAVPDDEEFELKNPAVSRD